MNTPSGQVLQTLFRSLRLKCPACGRATLYQRIYKLRERCAFCGMLFQREQGYFVGAMYINILFTELLALIGWLTCVFVLQATDRTLLLVMIVLALICPLLFYHHAQSLWLAFNYIVEHKNQRL
ncbi:MAG: DUF983 domain-containing protein [Acidobacteriota bacterium]